MKTRDERIEECSDEKRVGRTRRPKKTKKILLFDEEDEGGRCPRFDQGGGG